MHEFIVAHPMFSLFVAGHLGMLGHWLKRWLRAQTDYPMTIFFQMHWRAALGSMLVLTSTIIGMVGTGVVEATYQSLATAFLAGFNLNSIFTPHDEAK